MVTDNTIPFFSTFECICLRVTGGSFEGLVLCMYHPEPLHSDTFYQEFQELLFFQSSSCIVPHISPNELCCPEGHGSCIA